MNKHIVAAVTLECDEPQSKHRKEDYPQGTEFHPRLVSIHRPESKPWDEWTLKDFEIGKPLGEGAFGFVYLARDVKTKYIVALKVMHLPQIEEAGMEQQVNRETDIHAQLEHENIVSMLGCFRDEAKCIFVLEYAPGGDVYHDLVNSPNQRYDDVKASTYIYQVASALEYLHSKNIIHRDIKPENLLIGYYSEVKLSDFGWSIQLKPQRGGFNSKRKTVCGTLDYLPPEMLKAKRDGYDKTADLWCLGVLCFEFLVGKPPFESSSEALTKSNITDAELVFPKFADVDEDAKNLISKMLKKCPSQRPTLAMIKRHQWIQQNKSSEKKLLPIFQKYEHLLSPSLTDVYQKS